MTGAASRAVLLVESSTDLRQHLAARLTAACDTVVDVRSAELALHRCGCDVVDLVIANVSLPGLGILGLMADLRDVGGPPLLAYRAGAAPDDRVRWLDGRTETLPEDPVVLAALAGAAETRPRPRPSARHHRVPPS